MQTQVKSLSFKTPWSVYALHRFLFRKTNGGWNTALTNLISVLNPKYSKIETKTSEFKFNNEDVQKIVTELEENGCCTLPFVLPPEMVDRMVEFSKNTPVKCVKPTDSYSKDGIQFTNIETTVAEAKGKYARCVHDPQKLSLSNDVVKLIFDPLFLSISQSYIGSKPILGSFEMWWSFPVQDKEKFAAASAQKYHFDMDHIKFLNFFFYLTDVHENNGPHCYVKGSHRDLPQKFRKRGRFTDQDVEQHYKNNVVELKGKKGTILVVDTRGIHKGKILETDARLLFQIRYTNSLFGQVNQKVTVENLSAVDKNFINAHRDSYFNILP